MEQQNGEHSELSKELERLKSQLSTLEFKLTDKREKLSAADEAVAEFRAMTKAQKSESETLRVVQEQTSRTLQTYAQASILAGSFQELLTMSSRICANEYIRLKIVRYYPTLALSKSGDRKSTRLNSSHSV